MIDYHTKFQNNSLSSVTVALTLRAQRTDMYILLIVENKHAQRCHDIHSYFYKNPLTGTTVINGQKDRHEKEKSLFPGYMSNSFTVLLWTPYPITNLYFFNTHLHLTHLPKTRLRNQFSCFNTIRTHGCNTLSSLSSLLTFIFGGCIDLIRHNASVIKTIPPDWGTVTSKPVNVKTHMSYNACSLGTSIFNTQY